MTELESGYYSFSPKSGISFMGNNLQVVELPADAILIAPSAFHQTVSHFYRSDCEDTAIAYFKYDDYILHDLHFFHDIKGLKNV